MPDGPAAEQRRVVIEHVRPEIDDGRFPVKRVVGDTVIVEAAVFADGHDQVACRVLHWRQDPSDAHSSSMKPLGNDLWRGEFSVPALGRYFYTVEGWIDRFQTWRGDLVKRIAAAQDIRTDLLIGAALIEESASRASAAAIHAKTLRAWSEKIAARAKRRMRKDGRSGRGIARTDAAISRLALRHALQQAIGCGGGSGESPLLSLV